MFFFIKIKHFFFCIYKINYIEKFSFENNNFFFNNLSYDNLILNKLNLLDINQSSLNHSNNWLFSFTENFFSYTYNITYNIFSSYIYQENINLVNKIYWNKSISAFETNLLVSVILDQIYFISVFFLPFFDNFYNHLITTF